MSEKKPTPLVPQSKGTICPVCGNRTYSRDGIHPQCAAAQADAARVEKLKAERKREAAKAKPSTWRSKRCPMCNAEIHVRRKTCDCGHGFF